MKRLVFCFDGTWNRIDSACPTNVALTAESVLPLASGNVAQLIYYDEGVGTGRWDRIRGGVFGSGLVQNLADAYRFLIFNHSVGDEIYIFGFSRGAYTARSFAGLINCCGVLLRKHAGRVAEAIDRYRKRDSSDAYAEQQCEFRLEYCPHVCVSPVDGLWRSARKAAHPTPNLTITYLGVWDTVGALGIPASFSYLSFLNKKHHFHDTNLSPFVDSARHAVAIDERRKDFTPTLWTNIRELNAARGFTPEDPEAPYQQVWFPGTHSSVGGGGERRGLADLAMDWVLDGARRIGLQLDSGEYSRIFELHPNHKEFLEDTAKPSLSYQLMNAVSASDRMPGPEGLHEVGISARRRWKEAPQDLPTAVAYRPATLSRVAAALDALDPAAMGIGLDTSRDASSVDVMHVVVKDETLGALALAYYGDAKQWPRIYKANLDRVADPDRIYVGQTLRIPKG